MRNAHPHMKRQICQARNGRLRTKLQRMAHWSNAWLSSQLGIPGGVLAAASKSGQYFNGYCCCYCFFVISFLVFAATEHK